MATAKKNAKPAAKVSDEKQSAAKASAEQRKQLQDAEAEVERLSGLLVQLGFGHKV